MKRFFLLITFCATTCCSAFAEDWPMYRKDAGRTGFTSEELAESWRLKWTRELPVLTPAFHNARLQFDAGYEPVVAKGRLLLASSRTDSVKAYDAKTGKQLWAFYTNGPVRCAPAIWQDAVCFGSDDGYLYCLELETGEIRWKQRAVPSERMLLGNKRLISVWPVRGGPVIAEGRVYFAAGVWPFEGVFVYSMDIESGNVVWRNDRMGYLFGQQPHNTEAIGGLAPQGYLVINGDELIVPCSTAYPARLNLQTGELIEFALPSAGRFPGGWFAAIDAKSAKAIRRGKLTFDDVINRQLHEDKVNKGDGVSGLSRTIQVGETSLNFDDSIDEAKGLDEVVGTIHSMIVADGRLFVSTREGRIYCFEDKDDLSAEKTRNWSLERPNLAASKDESTQIRELLSKAVSEHGIAIVLGLQNGETVKALLEETHFHIVAIDDNADRVERLRKDLDAANVYGQRVAVIQSDFNSLELPPYLASLLISERTDVRVNHHLQSALQSLRPFGGIALLRNLGEDSTLSVKADGFKFEKLKTHLLVSRPGPLSGATDYNGDWSASADELVRFPLGVLWFDDSLAHFKRSPQPKFTGGVMISRPKNWHSTQTQRTNQADYPLLPVVLSDIYTGRVLDETEKSKLRSSLKQTDPTKKEPSQYRPPRQKNDWQPEQPVIGKRINPLTGKQEPRSFPKTYGCDGGVDYGSFFTLRSGTPAFYDKTIESGTVFLSGPRSGCTNSIIPAGGLLNVPYFYEGCTCSYPLPTALSLVAMPESHEQWSAWGESEIEPDSIERIGLNFGAPGDRITRSGTLWLDSPAVGGPSPKIRVEVNSTQVNYRYRHSLWMKGNEPYPWVSASMAEGIQRVTLKDLKPGEYTVRLYFAEPDDLAPGERIQTIRIQQQAVLQDFDVVKEAGGSMLGIVREFQNIPVKQTLQLDLSASKGKPIISGIEIVRNPENANAKLSD